jgi:8-oxo-dGTP pyrophosphatase MutT (NUDIX family)
MSTKVIIASGPVIVENGRALLNKHGETSFWKFCGGTVEDFGTDLIENARREVLEEMGVEIEILDPQPFVMHTRKETLDGPIDVLLVHYLAKRISEIKPGADIREWDWVDLKALPADLAPNILPTLRHFGFLK